jgi:hypothetical protein
VAEDTYYIEALGRPRHKWEGNVRKDHREIGQEGVEWMHLAQKGPVAGSREDGNESSSSVKGGEFLDKLNNYKLLKKDSTRVTVVILLVGCVETEHLHDRDTDGRVIFKL